LRDFLPMFNLIQECCASCYFNPIYLRPRYQAGLALQLLGILFFGRLRLPGGAWHSAQIRVAFSDNNQFSGLIIMRDCSNVEPNVEIYMCAVPRPFRGGGIGGLLIRFVIDNVAPGTIVIAECLPSASTMKQLLRRCGFQSVHRRMEKQESNYCEGFQYIAAGRLTQHADLD
jgi:GNAT superfamily N-acetyltransferase